MKKIPVVVCGNRSFDNALAELNHILEKNGCHSIAAAAVIARHSFSHVLAAGRPDDEDFLSHKKMVEENFGERKEARFFF